MTMSNADAKSTPPSIMPHHTPATAPALESSALSSPLHPSSIGPNADDDVDDPAVAMVDFQHKIGTLYSAAATDENTIRLPLTTSNNLGGDDLAGSPPKYDDGAGQVIDPAIVVTNANAGIPILSHTATAVQDDQKVSARDYITEIEVSSCLPSVCTGL